MGGSPFMLNVHARYRCTMGEDAVTVRAMETRSNSMAQDWGALDGAELVLAILPARAGANAKQSKTPRVNHRRNHMFGGAKRNNRDFFWRKASIPAIQKHLATKQKGEQKKCPPPILLPRERNVVWEPEAISCFYFADTRKKTRPHPRIYRGSS